MGPHAGRAGSHGAGARGRAVNVTESTYTITGLEPATTYWVQIRAFNDAGRSPDWSEPQSVQTLPPPPAVPRNIRINAGGQYLSAVWDEVPGATGYETRVFAASERPVAQIPRPEPFINVQYQRFAVGGTVQFRVRATGPGGRSVWSERVSAVTSQGDLPAAAPYRGGVRSDRRLDGRLRAVARHEEHLTFEVHRPPDRGQVTVEADGTFTFDPGDDFEDLAEGERISVSFLFRVRNADATRWGVDAAWITVTGANRPPAVQNVTGIAVDGGPGVWGVLDAVDPEGDALVFALLAAPAEGTATVSADGTFRFVPDGDFEDLTQGESRVVRFTYRVTDARGKSATGTVTVTVRGTNDAPVASAMVVTADEDDPAVSGHLRATDVDSDDLTFRLVTPPEAGTAAVDTRGAWIFSAGGDFEGLAAGETRTVSFTWAVEDEHGGSDEGTVTITVTGTNDAPVAAEMRPVEAVAGGPAVTGRLPAEDIDGDDLTYSLVSAPEAGTATVNADGTWGFDPVTGFGDLRPGRTRTVSFTWAVQDEHGASDEGTVTITVTGADRRHHLLPANATALERALSEAFDREAVLGPGADAVTGQRFRRPLTPGWGPWLILEYALGPVSRFFGRQEEAIDKGVVWQRLRGTPAAVAAALHWIGYAAAAVDDGRASRMWHRFQVAMGGIPPTSEMRAIPPTDEVGAGTPGVETLGVETLGVEAATLIDAEYLTAESAGARDLFFRGYHGYDIRALIASGGRSAETLLGDDSGVRVPKGTAGGHRRQATSPASGRRQVSSAKWSHGRPHAATVTLSLQARQALELDVEAGSGPGWAAIPWETPGLTWVGVGDLVRYRAFLSLRHQAYIAFLDEMAEPIGYRRVTHATDSSGADSSGTASSGADASETLGSETLVSGTLRRNRFVWEALTGFGNGEGRAVGAVALVFRARPSDERKPGQLWLEPDEIAPADGADVLVQSEPAALDFTFGATIRERVAITVEL